MKRYFPHLVYLALFLLPWQTRYIFDQKLLAGEAFEYGVLSMYVVQLLVVLCFFLGWPLQIHPALRVLVRRTGIFVLAAALSIPFSLNMDLSFIAWSHLLIAALLFLCLLDERIRMDRVALAFVAGLILPSLLGLGQFFWGSAFASTLLGLASHSASDLGTSVIEGEGVRWMRAYGSFGHPNLFGGYLAIGLITLVFGLRIDGRRRKSVIQLSLIPLLVFALILTFSRSAWIALTVGIVVFFAGMFWQRRRSNRLSPEATSVIPFAVMLLSVATAVIIFHEPFLARFNPVLATEARSVSERLDLLRSFPSVWKDDVIFGVGIGTYTIGLAAVVPGLPSFAYQPVHVSVLAALAEIGVAGLLASLYWLREFVRRLRPDPGALAVLAAVMTISLFDHYLWSLWSGLVLGAFVIGVALRRALDGPIISR